MACSRDGIRLFTGDLSQYRTPCLRLARLYSEEAAQLLQRNRATLSQSLGNSSRACRRRSRCYEFPPCRSDASPVRGSLIAGQSPLFVARIVWDGQPSVSNHQEDPGCRSVEHGNGLVRGRCGAGVQRTDGGCGQCRTRTAALYESVSRHWWQILTNGHSESA